MLEAMGTMAGKDGVVAGVVYRGSVVAGPASRGGVAAGTVGQLTASKLGPDQVGAWPDLAAGMGAMASCGGPTVKKGGGGPTVKREEEVGDQKVKTGAV
ncbi:hypothetical protein GUJ93_ZPchr0010g7662 [Zizania palustris]|uniref:Uncharacterized protein n=1 Tax=Zizania palustris TaxID=103762 RepID=A0A8J5W834_ZIZPA|nr:hypothetical protein GUJ93_ZPchr0010g7662 [Zizania palustris]